MALQDLKDKTSKVRKTADDLFDKLVFNEKDIMSCYKNNNNNSWGDVDDNQRKNRQQRNKEWKCLKSERKIQKCFVTSIPWKTVCVSKNKHS